MDNPTDRTFTAYAELTQPPEVSPGVPASAGMAFTNTPRTSLLSPGAFVRARVVADVAEERWLLPRRAVRSDAVWLVEDGRVRRQAVDVAYLLERDTAEGGADTQWAVLEGDRHVPPR